MKRNTVIGASATFTRPEQTAIFSANNRNYFIKCNDITNTTDGFRFFGANNGSLQSNNIVDHSVGLHVALGSLMAGQNHQGNLWLGTYTNIGALHQNYTTSERYIFDQSMFTHQTTRLPFFWFDGQPNSDADCGQ